MKGYPDLKRDLVILLLAGIVLVLLIIAMVFVVRKAFFEKPPIDPDPPVDPDPPNRVLSGSWTYNKFKRSK